MKLFTKSGLLPLTLIFSAVLIFSLSFIRESSHQVQSRLEVSSTPTPSANDAFIVPTHGDYILPYPGILPTNPLYPIKMVRDRLGLLFTTNPNRLPPLLLHYADKRIAATTELIQNGMSREAISTAIKAEIYLGQAISASADMDPTLMSSFSDQLKQSALKHEEIIETLIELSDGETKNQAARLHQQLDQYRHQIVSISGQPFGYLRPEDCGTSLASPSASPSEESPFPETQPHL